MKSLATSTVLHVVILTWGLWAIGTTPPLDMSASEALPVSLVPIDEYSSSIAGAEDAPLTETPAPEETETEATLPMPAENVGDNEVDLATPPRPEAAPRETVQTATAETPPPPTPEPLPEPEPQPVVEETPPPVPTPEPEPEVAEQPPAPEEPPVIDEAAPQVAEAPPEPAPPRNVPTPQLRPTPPRPAPEPTRTAERTPTPPTPARQTPPTPPREPARTESQSEPEFDADEIGALLNRERSAGGGAQRSDQTAALGGTRTTGATLTASELDALRGQIQRCWNPPAGVSEAGSLRISIQMRLDQSGALQGMPQIVSGGGASMIERVAGEAALRAIRLCAPYNLPVEKYDTWSQVQINFDPSQMF